MARARGSVWLWDEPDSDLVRMAQAQGARVRPFPGIRNRQEASEVLCEIRRIPNAELPLFAWARQNGLANIGGAPYHARAAPTCMVSAAPVCVAYCTHKDRREG